MTGDESSWDKDGSEVEVGAYQLVRGTKGNQQIDGQITRGLFGGWPERRSNE